MKTTIEKSLLRQVEQLCEQRNVRLTPQRLEVLRLMSQQNSAISAYNLLNLLRQSEPQAKPPTVYRALYFLLKQGFIHRVESINSFLLCHYFSEPSHTYAFFICDRCGLVTEQTTRDIKDILQHLATIADFNLSHSVVEVHGFCSQCAEVRICENSNLCEQDFSTLNTICN